jgi:hypothetical protein
VHDSAIAVAPGGTLIDDSGVPGGTFTFSEIVCPLASWTVTTHESAEATGNQAMPWTTSIEPAAASRTVSFRRLNTLG